MWPKGKPRNDAKESFLSMVEKIESCWLWIGYVDKDGYGFFRRGGAHRFAVRELGGKEIPAGMQIDHLCRNRRCVNPDHLEIVTSKTNTLRGVSIQAQNAEKTHCKRGHAFDGTNTYNHAGRRICRACVLIHKKESKMNKPYALRQGDVMLRSSPIPTDAKRITLRPAALGEVTGHHHSFISNTAVATEELVEMYEGSDGLTYVRVSGEPDAASLVHQEHKAHAVPAGDYVVVIQQENTDWGSRAVID